NELMNRLSCISHLSQVSIHLQRTIIKQAKHFNIFPIDLSIYLKINEQHPIYPLLNELTQDTAEYLSALTKEELNHLVESLPSGARMMIDYDSSFQSKQQLERIAIHYISTLIHQDYFSFKRVVKNDLSKSVVLKTYPELQNQFDKDGLLFINDDFILIDWGIIYKDHILHYHQFLRRGYTSNPNFDFLNQFIKVHHETKSNNSFRIAIDHQRIMPKEFFLRIYEFDTWYGPPFNSEKLDDPNYIGLTLVKRNPDSLFGLTNSLDRTEFYWSYKDGIKTFEVEEISNSEFKFENFNFNRYVHSERDIEKHVFRHLDGAVKVYVDRSYNERHISNIPQEYKSHKKVKLWRIDGDLKLQHWLDLICFFFKSNEMLIEYFNPEEFKKIFELRVRNFKKWKALQQSESST
ncbi:MAG: hypothetical protein ACMUJM_25640, partial [bacterium]